MTKRSQRRPLSTQGRPEYPGIQPPRPWPSPPRKPQYFRLLVELTMGPIREAVTLVERGPLGLCEQRGMDAANYGMFRLSENGTREWHRPTRIMIEPVKDEEVVEG